jgi:hypothetical protein
MKESADEVLDRALPIPSDKQAPGSEAPASATVHAWNQDNFGVLFTLRDTDGRSLFARMGNFCKVLKAEGWKPDWKNDMPTVQTATTSQPVAPQEALGNCPKCGAPNKMSSKGKPYCSKVCWKT